MSVYHWQKLTPQGDYLEDLSNVVLYEMENTTMYFTKYKISRRAEELLQELLKKNNLDESCYIRFRELGIISQALYTDAYLINFDDDFSKMAEVRPKLLELRKNLDTSPVIDKVSIKMSRHICGGEKTMYRDFFSENMFVNIYIKNALLNLANDEKLLEKLLKTEKKNHRISEKEKIYKRIKDEISTVKHSSKFIAIFCHIFQIPIKDNHKENCNTYTDLDSSMGLKDLYNTNHCKSISTSLNGK